MCKATQNSSHAETSLNRCCEQLSDDALIRARYVVSMLNMAHSVGLTDARPLIEALAAEAVRLDTNGLVIEAEARAIAAVKRIAEALRQNRAHDQLWQNAIEAAQAWECRAAETPVIK